MRVWSSGWGAVRLCPSEEAVESLINAEFPRTVKYLIPNNVPDRSRFEVPAAAA
jgi:hypothetical protein